MMMTYFLVNSVEKSIGKMNSLNAAKKLVISSKMHQVTLRGEMLGRRNLPPKKLSETSMAAKLKLTRKLIEIDERVPVVEPAV